MTNRENLIRTLRENRVLLESEKLKLIKEIWNIETKIELINEKLKAYGKLDENPGVGESSADVG